MYEYIQLNRSGRRVCHARCLPLVCVLDQAGVSDHEGVAMGHGLLISMDINKARQIMRGLRRGVLDPSSVCCRMSSLCDINSVLEIICID